MSTMNQEFADTSELVEWGPLSGFCPAELSTWQGSILSDDHWASAVEVMNGYNFHLMI